MDPKGPDRMLLAPSRAFGGALRLSSRAELRSVDEHLVQPETTREEIVRDRHLIAMPALPPHGDQHCRVDYVITAHVAVGYVGSTDLLTRVAEGSNFATDTCIRKEGIDPRTRARYLEEVVFEVVYEQSRSDMTDRAEDLAACGVRRIFAIFVKKGEVCEWSRSAGTWRPLDAQATIDDATLQRPLAVSALLDAAAADDAVARALLAKDNRVIAEVLQDRRLAGHREGQLAILAELFERRLGRGLTEAERATLGKRLDRLGLGRLDDVRGEHRGEALAVWLADPAAS